MMSLHCCSFCQRWSPRGRPWPRGRPRGHILKSLALALASKPQVLGLGLGLEALGPRKLACPRLEDSTIFKPLKFCWKTPESSRKICKYLFYFAQLEHRLSQAGLPPNWNFTNDKNVSKSLLFLQFQFLFSVFSFTPVANNNILKTRGPGTHSNQFLPANLNVNLEKMDSFRPKSCYLRITSSLFINVMH